MSSEDTTRPIRIIRREHHEQTQEASAGAVVAQIYIHQTLGGYGWSLTLASGGSLSCSDHVPTPSEATWSAVDELRDRDLSGRVAIHSACAMRVAVVPLYAVPSYDFLPWVETATTITLTTDRPS